MAVTERERIELTRALEDKMGRTAASTLMEYLPASGWRDVATVSDLDNVHLHIDNVRLELKTDIAELRTELKTDIGELRTEMREGLAKSEAKMTAELSKISRQMITWTIATFIAFSAALIAAVGTFKP